MSAFTERLNEWLIEQDKEPVEGEMVGALNEVAAATADWLLEHEDEIVREVQRLMADMVAGKPVDPEARAEDLFERLGGRGDAAGDEPGEDDQPLDLPF